MFMKKRIIAILLSLSMIIPGNVAAAAEQSADTLSVLMYESEPSVDEATVEVTESYEDGDGSGEGGEGGDYGEGSGSDEGGSDNASEGAGSGSGSEEGQGGGSEGGQGEGEGSGNGGGITQKALCEAGTDLHPVVGRNRGTFRT